MGLFYNEDANYCATVVKVHNLIKLEKMDNCLGFPCMGFMAIVGKDVQIGDYGILFTAETQLSESYCRENNLFRHETLNKDVTKKGYFEDTRRVRAIKLRGNVSSAVFMPISSIEYLGASLEDVKEGTSFTHVNGEEICRKYLPKRNPPGLPGSGKSKLKQFTRITTKLFPEHSDTSHLFKNMHLIPKDATVSVTQKLHGTSARFTNQVVMRKLRLHERLLKFLGFSINEQEYDVIAGSRRLIKDTKDIARSQMSFYTENVWNQTLEKIKHVIPKGYVIYGEIIGWAGERPIQKGYVYGFPQGQHEFYVYRIAVVNPDGVTLDLTWDQVKEFCSKNGLNRVPEIWNGKFENFPAEYYLNRRFKAEGFHECLPVESGLYDEGYCVRMDAMTPIILKGKSPEFLQHETKILDSGDLDMETAETVQAEG